MADTHEEFHRTKFDELETEIVKIAAVRISQQKVEQKHQKWTLMTGEKFLQQNSLVDKKLCTTNKFAQFLETFLAGSLIQFNNNSGLYPIG